MKVTQEKLPASQIGLEIEIPPEMSKQAYEKTLQEFTRFANIPGFRKGKVPRQVLIQRFGSNRIKAAALQDLIEDSLKQVVEQEKIEAIGEFELRSSIDDLVTQFEPGSPLTFSAAVDIPPEVNLHQYTGLEAKAEEIKYDPERVDTVLEDYRKRSATLVPVEGRAAQEGDVAIVDFSGRLSAEGDEEAAEIPGGSAQDFEIELTEGRFIPGFVDGIIGMNSGETKEISVTFPEDYPQADLAGKPAVFAITLKDLKERELPELDDDFAQEISEFGTLSELRESLETRFREEAEQKTKDNKQEALLNELVKQVEVELPESLIKREINVSITQTAMRLEQQGMDIRKTFTNEIVSMLQQQARPEAIARLQRTLALGEIAKKESLEVDSETVDAKVNEFLEDYKGQEIDTERLRQILSEDLLKDKILDWLEEHGTVELVPEGTLTPEPDADALETDVPEEADLPEGPPAAAIADQAEVEAATATVDVVAEPAVEPSAAPSVEETAKPAAESEVAEESKQATGASKKSKSKASKQAASSDSTSEEAE